MYRFRYLSVLVLALTSINYVQSKMCDKTEINCTTRAAQKVFKAVTGGAKGIIEPIVLRFDKLDGQVSQVKYQVFNGILTGLENCQLTMMKIDSEQFTYSVELHCPQLILKHSYVSKGSWDDVEFDSPGSATVTYNDYVIFTEGVYGVITSEVDNKKYQYIKSYKVRYEPRGEIGTELTMLHTDGTKDNLAKDFITKNVKEFEKVLRTPIMDTYIDILVKGVDTYLRRVPEDEVYSV